MESARSRGRLSVIENHLDPVPAAGSLGSARDELEAFADRCVRAIPGLVPPPRATIDRWQSLFFPYPQTMREKMTRFLEERKDLFIEKFDGTLHDLRKNGFARLKTLLEARFVSVEDISRDALKYFDWIESIHCNDLGCSTMASVVFNLFGACILYLGSDEQRAHFLPDIDNGKIYGCFAMSELGHGTNVAGLMTSATYDHGTDTFDIHTPDDLAQKFWIGLAGMHATHAIVFARLILPSTDTRVGSALLDKGVHPFVVRLRHVLDGEPLPGITIHDCGHQGAFNKEGLNSIDNGRISFSHVRIARTDLLSKYAFVDRSGEYHCKLATPGQRFGSIMSALVVARLVVGTGSARIAAQAMNIATRYAHSRRQFGRPGATTATAERGSSAEDVLSRNKELALIQYPMHQRRLLTHIAKAYAILFFMEDAKQLYAAFAPTMDPLSPMAKEVHLVACLAKACGSFYAVDSIDVARQSCGGQGYLVRNIIASYRTDTDIFTSFDGDNHLLLLTAGKMLLEEVSRRSGLSLRKIAVQELRLQCGLLLGPASPTTVDAFLRLLHLRFEMLRYVEAKTMKTKYSELRASHRETNSDNRSRIEAEMFDFFNRRADRLVRLATVYFEWSAMRSFCSRLERIRRERDGQGDKNRDGWTSADEIILSNTAKLYALQRVLEDPWFVVSLVVSPEGYARLQAQAADLYDFLHRHAMLLVSAFGGCYWMLRDTIAGDWTAQYPRDKPTGFSSCSS